MFADRLDDAGLAEGVGAPQGNGVLDTGAEFVATTGAVPFPRRRNRFRFPHHRLQTFRKSGR